LWNMPTRSRHCCSRGGFSFSGWTAIFGPRYGTAPWARIAMNHRKTNISISTEPVPTPLHAGTSAGGAGAPVGLRPGVTATITYALTPVAPTQSAPPH
jgi:hypothetical protein